jgi:hypothetical protein
MGKNSDAFQLDFICIGAQRSGTTWLDRMLRAHPQIRMPVSKEVNFFNDYVHFESLSGKSENYAQGLDWYRDRFESASDFLATGEVTPAYMDRPEVPGRINRHFPGVKLIALLRHPVERTYSNYLFYKNALLLDDSPTLEEAVRRHPAYLERSRYHLHLRRYLEHFPAARLKVVLFDDILARPADVLRDIYTYLGVDPAFIPPDIDARENPAAQARSRFLARWLGPGMLRTAGMLRRWHLDFLVDLTKRAGADRLIQLVRDKWNLEPLEKPPLDTRTAQALQAGFTPDIDALESLLNLDLTAWKTGKPSD